MSEWKVPFMFFMDTFCENWKCKSARDEVILSRVWGTGPLPRKVVTVKVKVNAYQKQVMWEASVE